MATAPARAGAVGSFHTSRYMICCAGQKTHGHARITRVSHASLAASRVRFSHVSVFFDSHNWQKRVTKSDTLGHSLWCSLEQDVVQPPRRVGFCKQVGTRVSTWGRGWWRECASARRSRGTQRALVNTQWAYGQASICTL